MNDRLRSDYTVFAGSVGSRSPGKGAWSAVVMVDCGTGIEHAVVSGCGDHVTNVDMELTAVLMGITRVPLGTSATVVTSSKYVLDCVGLLALGWKGGDSHLWQRLAHEVEQRYINWHHIEENDPSPNVIKARELALAAATTV